MNTSRQVSPPFKRRVSEGQHAYSKPTSTGSIVMDRDHDFITTPANTRYTGPSKRAFIYILLVAIGCSCFQYRLLVPGLRYTHSSSQAPITSSQVVTTSSLNIHGTFTLQEPTYEIIVLPGSVQHQNTTWRNTIVSKAGQTWTVQIIAWLCVMNGGLRPEHSTISAFCRDGTSNEQGVNDTRAEVKVMWTDPKDRGIGQDVMLIIECDLIDFEKNAIDKISLHPEPQRSSGNSSSETITPSTNTIRSATQSTPSFKPLYLDHSFEHDLGMVSTSSSGSVPLNLWFVSTDLSVVIQEQIKDKVNMAVCLSPTFYDKEVEMPLKKWVEWRQHMRNLGVERVNWYGRSEDMGLFVNSYNKLKGMKDVFRHSPPLGDHPNWRTNPYHDQDAYLTECILHNRLSSDFILVLDYDEYPMINFDDLSNRSMSEQWLAFMRSLPEDRGSWEMTRVPMSAMAATDGNVGNDELIQDQLTCVNGLDKKVKSMYNSQTVLAVNQHKKMRMFPIGEEVASRFNANPDRPFWEKGWDSSKSGAWPKLLHYRWFTDLSENGCTNPSPLNNSPAYDTYKAKLRRDVSNLVAALKKEMGFLAA